MEVKRRSVARGRIVGGRNDWEGKKRSVTRDERRKKRLERKEIILRDICGNRSKN